MNRPVLLPLWAAVWLGGLSLSVHAQQPSASRLIPADDWTVELVGRLVERGFLPSVYPLIQPYRQSDLVRDLAALDPDTIGGPEAEWVRVLKAALVRVEDRRYDAWLEGGGTASTSRRTDVMRPLGEGNVWPRGQVGVWGVSGPLVAEVRLIGDRHALQDPDGTDPGQRRGGRVDHAYLSAQAEWGAVTLGRLSPNWAPAGVPGLMLSANAHAYPFLAVDARLGPFVLHGFTAELDTILGAKRYLAAHRLDYQRGPLALGVSEILLYAGPGASPSLRYAIPVLPFFFDAEKLPDDVELNLALGLHAWYRGRTVTAAAELFVDDIVLSGGFPHRYAFRAGARVARRGARWTGELEYTQVSAFAYRAVLTYDRLDFLGRGLGEHAVDFDGIRLAVDLFPPVTGLRVGPVVNFRRQGEGRIESEFPETEEFRAGPNIFLGTVETTLRFGIRGRYQVGTVAWIGWDAGRSYTWNDSHEEGARRGRFTGVAHAGLRLTLP